MKVKLTLLLPLVQVIVGAALVVSSLQQANTFEHPAGEKLGWRAFVALNLPATIVRYELLERPYNHMLLPVEPIGPGIVLPAHIALVALQWYVIAFEIGHRLQRTVTKWTRRRAAMDVIAILFGLFVLAGAYQGGARTISLLWTVWGTLIMAYYSRDLWNICRQRLSSRRA